MSKDTVSDWSTTPASNTDVGGVDLAENSMRPRDVNNAIRTMMAQIATGIDGGAFITQYVPASASTPAYLDFYEDTDNGTNRVRLITPAAVAADVSVTLPGVAGTIPTGPTSTTDNTIPRFDGTAGALQTSGIVIDDSDNMTLASTVQFSPQIIARSDYNGLQGGYVYFQKGRAGGPTQSGDEMGTFIGAARDSASAMVNSAYFTFATTAAPAAGSVDGKVFFATVQSAVSAVRLTIQAGLVVGSATGGDKGAGTVNATGLYVQGVSISPPGAPVTKTADFTVAATEQHLVNNKSGSTCTVTLPTASSFPGRELTIKTIQAQTVVSASSNVVPLGTGTAGTAILSANAGRWAKLVSDGTNWVIMEGVV